MLQTAPDEPGRAVTAPRGQPRGIRTEFPPSRSRTPTSSERLPTPGPISVHRSRLAWAPCRHCRSGAVSVQNGLDGYGRRAATGPAVLCRPVFEPLEEVAGESNADGRRPRGRSRDCGRGRLSTMRWLRRHRQLSRRSGVGLNGQSVRIGRDSQRCSLWRARRPTGWRCHGVSRASR